MPLYEYRCPLCDRVEDAMHGANKRLALHCPTCESLMVRKFPAPALRTDTTFMANRPEATRRGSGVFCSQLNKVIYGRGDVKRICEQEGHGCAEVGVAKREPAEEQRYEVNPTIVADEVDRVVDNEREGHATPEERKELHEKLTHTLRGKQFDP